MPTIYYYQNDPTAYKPGLQEPSGDMSKLVHNHRWLYATHRPMVASSLVGPSDGTGALNDTGGWLTNIRLMIPKNLDKRTIQVHLKWFGRGSARAIYGGGAATGNFVESSFDWVTLEVTPSSVTHPSELYVITYNTSGTVYINAVAVTIKQDDADTGIATSGWTFADYATLTDTNQPVVSEWCERLVNGPRAIAIDRPSCLVSLIDDASGSSSRAIYSTNSSAITTLARFMMPISDASPRNYRISAYWDVDTSTTFEGTVSVGGFPFSFSSSGWTHHTASLSAGGADCRVTAKIASGSGYCYLRSLQIIREP